MEIGINNVVKVGGQLAGHALVKNNIITEEHWYDKPVKNKVVNSGLEGWLRGRSTGGSSWLAPRGSSCLWVGAAQSLLRFCAYGGNNTPTTPTMTQLQQRTSGYTTTVFFLTGRDFCGTKYDLEGGVVTMRITHRFPIVTDAAGHTVAEIGWFSNINNTPTDDGYRMFSRVALPTPVIVPQDHVLQVTYEVNVKVPYMQEVRFEDLQIDGWNVGGVARMCARFPNSNVFGSLPSGIFSTISATGTDVLPPEATNNYNIALLDPAWQYSGGDASGSGRYFGASEADVLFPAIGVEQPALPHRWRSSANSFTDVGRASYDIMPYRDGSHERGIRWVLGLNFPGDLQVVNWRFLNINGLGFRLDQPVQKHHNEQVTIEYYLKLEAD